MTSEQWKQVWAIYDAATEQPDIERPAILQTVTDETVRAKVLDLLSRPEERLDEEPAPAEPMEWAWTGKTLGRFEMRRPLGRGGMGEVYEAYDPELRRLVAIKCVAPSRLNVSVESFLQEARAASALNHPGIVTIYEVIRDQNTVGIVMELVEGRRFRELTRQAQPIANVALWGQRIAEALTVTHARGILHRDIKPENLILRPDGYVKILDFGLALEPAAGNAEIAPTGTVRYMSPEQARGGRLTPATDIFSLGTVLYEMATGVHPFAAATHAESNSTLAVGSRAALADPAPPASLGLPPDFEQLLLAMLAKTAAARPSAAAVAQSLASLSTGIPLRRFFPAKWAIVAAIAVLGAVGFTLRSNHPVGHREVAPQAGTLLTGAPGRESDPAFSPDGKWLAYAWDGGAGDKRDIYVKQVQGGDPVRLTATPEDEWSPSWSPNGHHLAFLRRGSTAIEAMTIPAAGGAATLVSKLHPAESILQHRVTWSLEDVVFGDVTSGKGLQLYGNGMQLYAAAVNTGARRPFLANTESGTGYDHSPRQSPDGRLIAFIRLLHNSSELRIVPRSGGESRPLATISGPLKGFAWAPDGRRIVYHTSVSKGLYELWQVDLAGSAPVRAPFAFPAGSGDLELSPDGRTAAYSLQTRDTNLWQVSATGEAPRKIAASTRADDDGAYSADGKWVAFTSNRSGLGLKEVWVAESSGANPRRLTFLNGFAGSPSWSPDGRRIAFNWANDTAPRLYTVDVRGGTPQPLLDPTFDGWVSSWSRDGRTIYFASSHSGSPQIWRTPVDGRTPPVQLTRDGGFESRESNDGKSLIFSKRPAKGIWRIALGQLEAKEEKIVDFDPVRQFRCWGVGPTGLFLAAPSAPPRLEHFDFSGGRGRAVAAFPTELPTTGGCLSVHPSGQHFLYSILESDRQEIYVAQLPQF